MTGPAGRTARALAAGLLALLLGACTSIPGPTADLVIRGAWVHDGTGAEPMLADVAISGGLFSAVGGRPSARRSIDGRGLHLVPGLIDMHVHVGAVEGRFVDGPSFVARGVTTVRDLGGFTAAIRAAERSADGPKIHSALTTLNGEAMSPFHRRVSTEAEAASAVADLARAGAAVIKIHRAFPPALLPALVAAARDRNLGVTGHIPLGLHPLRACEAGMAGIEHVGSFVEAYASAVTGAKQDDAIRYLLSAESDPLYRCLADRKVTVTPTLVLYESIARTRSGSGPMSPQFRQFIAQMQAITLRLHRAGVALAPGTDSSELDRPAVTPGVSMLRELELLRGAGIGGSDLMRIVAANPARMLGIDRLGRLIAPGKSADFLILSADPRTAAGAYSVPSSIYLRGRPIAPAPPLP